jgi:HPt (histidine-containing phosphotransfer) domain-containing protein
MTANVLPEQIRLARAMGVDDILFKPFTVVELYDVLERVGQGSPSSLAPMDQTQIDAGVLVKLTGLIGETKVRALLSVLAHTLSARFAGDLGTEEGRLALRRDAHASVAGAGMLGFTRLAALCTTLENASDDVACKVAFADLEKETARVIDLSRSLASGTTGLATGIEAPDIQSEFQMRR